MTSLKGSVFTGNDLRGRDFYPPLCTRRISIRRIRPAPVCAMQIQGRLHEDPQETDLAAMFVRRPELLVLGYGGY
ncbi:hypothetical protein Q2941_11065 [Bradyrhizobium sp. UFLA05-153]